MHTLWPSMVVALLGLAVSGCDPRSPPGGASPEAEVRPQPAASATDAVPPAAAPSATQEDTLMVATEGASGPYLTNSAGSALYMLEGNENGTRCSTEECLAAWPPMLASAAVPSADAGLQPALVGQLGRVDGSVQMTYNGHPLHRYAADTGVGSTAGHGVEDKWGEWYLLTPQGNAVAEAGE